MKFVFPSKVEGWLTREEGRLLFKLARLNPYLGSVVELGSFQGRSTVCLAQGSKSRGGGKVFTVDKFVGDDIIGPYSDFYPQFKQNIKRYDLEDNIVVFRGNSLEIVKKWLGQIRLLFIDASHHYKDVSVDFHTWEKYLVPGGIIVFHDSICWPGVYRLVCEVIASGRFKNFKTYLKPISPINGITYASKNEKGMITPRVERFQALLQFKILSLPKLSDRIKQTVKDRGEADIWFKILGSFANLWKSLRGKSYFLTCCL